MRTAQPSDRVMASARAQVTNRMPGKIRILRQDDHVTQIANSLDVMLGSTLVYQGRARLVLTVSEDSEGEDEQQYLYAGGAVIPYMVDQRVIRPIVEDILLVDEHPDLLYVGLAFRVKGLGAAGHMPLFREVKLQGIAPQESWFDVTATPIREQA